MALPDLGRNVRTVRRLWGVQLISEKVDESADITAGQVAKRILDSNGNIVYTVCDATSKPAGIFFGHKNTYFYVPVADEEVTFDEDTKNLDHPNIKNGSVVVTSQDKSTTYTEDTDYTINYTNGQITRTSTGSITSGATVLVSYRYKDPNESGLDQTLGVGKLSVAKGRGEMGTLVYDTSNVINLNDDLRCNANGLLSTDSSLSGTVVGVVTKPPTADDPELIFELK